MIEKNLIFDVNAKEVDISIKCPNCGVEIIDYEIIFPSLNYDAEKTSDMTNSENLIEICNNCDYELGIIATSYTYGYEISIEDENVNDDDVEIVKVYEHEYDYEDHIFFQEDYEIDIDYNFMTNITDINHLVKLGDKSTHYKEALYRFAYMGCFGAIEGYLQEKLIDLIKKDEDALKSLAKFPELDKTKKTLVEIVNMDIKKHVISQVNKIVFHDFSKVEKMYKFAINVDLELGKYLSNFIEKRHDIVHRLNKGRSGSSVIVNRSEVSSLINNIQTVHLDIENKVKEYEDSKKN